MSDHSYIDKNFDSSDGELDGEEPSIDKKPGVRTGAAILSESDSKSFAEKSSYKDEGDLSQVCSLEDEESELTASEYVEDVHDMSLYVRPQVNERPAKTSQSRRPSALMLGSHACLMEHFASCRLIFAPCTLIAQAAHLLRTPHQAYLRQSRTRIVSSLLGISRPRSLALFENGLKKYAACYEQMLLKRQEADSIIETCQESSAFRTPSLSDYNDSQFYDCRTNESNLSRGGVSQNLQSTLDFLTSVNYQERAEIVNQCCADRRDHFFH